MHAMRGMRAVGMGEGLRSVPPRFIEYAYYISVFNGIFGPAIGISVPLLGAGMLAVLAGICVRRVGLRSMAIYRPLAFPVGCAISYIGVQLVVHEESLMDDYVRFFVPWILSLIIVQSLSMRRGFLHRFALVALGIGLTTLPYLAYQTEGFVERAGLDRTTGIGDLAHANALAAWFGFCCVYFAILGLETKRNLVRIASWIVTVGCLFVVGLTVSRSGLFAVGIAIIVALRHRLKRGFIPVLLLVIFSWIVYESGLFEGAIAFYAERGMEDTGRFSVWPIALQRFLDSPLAGVGVSDIETYTESSASPSLPIPPHNSFLFIALASGIIPLVFYVAYWMRAAQGAFRANAQRLADAPFLIPLLTYVFLLSVVGDAFFVSPWSIVTLSAAIAAGVARPVRRVIIRQIERNKNKRALGTTDKVRHVVKGYRV